MRACRAHHTGPASACRARAYIGGPLALIETGDMIEVDVPNRILNVDISDADMAARRENGWHRPRYERGWDRCIHSTSNRRIRDVISISFAGFWGPRTRARDKLMAGQALCGVSGILLTPLMKAVRLTHRVCSRH